MTWNRERGDRARGTTATSHKHIYNNMPQTADQMRMAKVEPSSTPHRTGVAALPTFGALPAMASVGLGRGRVGQIRSCRLRSKLCEGQFPPTHWMLWLCSVAILVVAMISISSMDLLMNQYDYHIMFYPYISSYELNDRSTAKVSQFKSHCRANSYLHLYDFDLFPCRRPRTQDSSALLMRENEHYDAYLAAAA